MIAKMCEECHLFVTAKCEGKEQEKVNKNKRPCKKYQLIDYEQLDNELHQEEPTAEPKKPTVESTKPADKESKSDKFTRICRNRLGQVRNEIRKLGNLGAYYTRKDGSRVYAYDWTNEQRDDLIKVLGNEIEKLRKTLTK